MLCSYCEEDKPRSAFSETQMHKAEKKCKTCLAGTRWLSFPTPTPSLLCTVPATCYVHLTVHFCMMCTVPATRYVNLRVHSDSA